MGGVNNRGALLLLACLHAPAHGAPDMGKLLAMGGVSQLEGAGGGGLSPWALITGYGSRDSWGANAHFTSVRTQDFALDSAGMAAGIGDRLELSLAQQHFTGSRAPLDRLSIRQDIIGIKLKLAGDALYEQDRAMPQLSVGLLHKRNKGIAGLAALGVSEVGGLGARGATGTDVYLAASKLYLDSSLLLNGTLRATRANQMGLLGFGGERGNAYQVMPELSAAMLINRRLLAGVEYRHKPHNLAVDPEQANYDAFVAWFPTKHVSVTAAYAVLGRVTVLNPSRQRGAYLSVQTGF